MRQPTLFRQPDTWLHFIGGYYRTSALFLREAKKHGFSRRIPAQVARGMHFGDKVIFLRYGGQTAKPVFAFGEGIVTRVSFDAQIATQLGQELERRGLAEYTPGGDTVLRECGSYLMVGTWTVAPEIDIPQLIEAAMRIAQAQNLPSLFVMLGGELTAAYEAPVFLQPAPHFTRGFIKTEPGSTFRYAGMSGDYVHKMLAVKHYRKAEKSVRPPRVGRKTQGQKSLNF